MKEDMELTQEDLLGDNSQSNEHEKEDVSNSKKKDVPFGYIPIILDSCGKLTAPEVLHFRDFTPEELSHIALSKNKRDNIKRITDCLNKMVFENFDCTYLHLDDALKIVLTLYGSFYMSTIEKEYYINPDIEDEECRLRYVALSRAEERIFIYTPTLSEENKQKILALNIKIH